MDVINEWSNRKRKAETTRRGIERGQRETRNKAGMMHRASADAHPAALATATDATAVADVDYSRPTESLQVLTGVRGRRRFASRRRRRERTCGGGEDDSVVCEDGVEKLIRRKTTTMEAMAMQGRIREVGPAATVAAYFGFVRVPRRPLRMVRIGRRAPPLWTAWTIRIKSLPARPPLLLMLALLLIITTTQAVVASSLDEERSSSQYPAAAGIASPPLPRLRSLAVVDDDLVEDNILAANHVLPRIASTGNDDYDCPPLPTNKERCATVTGWAKLAEMVAAAQYLPGRRSKNNKNDKNVTNADEAADDGDDPFVPNSGRLVLCPFSIPKLSSAKSIPITGSLSLLCVDENGKTNKKGGGGEEYEPSCVISGGGTHLQIRGRNADAVDVVGFRFGGATKNSIRIGNGGAVKKALEADAAKGEGEGGGIDDGGTAPGPAPKAEQSAGAASSSAASTTRGSNAGLVRICSSTFGRNRYRGKKRSQGGAVRLGPNTRLYVSSSSFRYNSARQGGALYNYGMELVVSDCSFSRNQANKGGAIRSASGSDLTVSDSVFEFNGSKGEGISVSSKQHEKGATSASEDRTVNADTKERQGEWFDAGGNTGRGNGECNGYTEEGPGKFDYCYEFPPAKGKKNKGQGAAGGAIEGIPLTSEPTSRPTRKPTPQPTNKPTVPPEITSEKSSYRYDEDVVLTIRNAKLGPSNWVGLAKRGSGQGGKLPQGVVGRNWKLVCEGSAQQTCKKRNVFSETIEPGLYQGYLLADNVHPYSILASTDPFEVEDPPFQSFRPGKLTVKDQETGLSLSEGLQVRLIGKVGYRLKFDSLEARQGESSMGLHATPDGAGIVRDGSGWIYVSNSEQNDGKGGVYTVHFDGQGRIKDYKQRLGGTTRNCAGGIMPWGSWVSCEEYAGGQVSCAVAANGRSCRDFFHSFCLFWSRTYSVLAGRSERLQIPREDEAGGITRGQLRVGRRRRQRPQEHMLLHHGGS
uniref:Right handed beta helix domain-containing protein n=1 Tax=Odontella aurita TaxID=265563 RepID=A0A7S4I5N8_9STRA|mmetsp:Transcript_20330/g.58771  ORF Transcript_20330/g.58771 Transcript_20330/m.58771 type:complete len:980 (+) Transcript_20330:208-3147(+)